MSKPPSRRVRGRGYGGLEEAERQWSEGIHPVRTFFRNNPEAGVYVSPRRVKAWGWRVPGMAMIVPIEEAQRAHETVQATRAEQRTPPVIEPEPSSATLVTFPVDKVGDPAQAPEIVDRLAEVTLLARYAITETPLDFVKA